MKIKSFIYILLACYFGTFLRLYINNNFIVSIIGSLCFGYVVAKKLNQNIFPSTAKEIILSSNTTLYSFPEIHAKELLVLQVGTTLSVLRNWKVSEGEVWVRVELASNKFLDNPNKITKGWIKM